MHELLKSLLELQKIDSDLHFLDDLKVKRPRELDKDKGRLQRARDAKAAILTGVKELRMGCDRGELELQEKQADIDKFQVSLNTAKTNQEYQIFKDKIERITDESSHIEEMVLEAFNRIDSLNAEKTGVEGSVVTIQQELDKKQEEMDGFLGEVNEKLKILGVQRDERVKEIPADALELYTKVLERYQDLALAVVEDNVCQGCYMTVTKQDRSQLLMGQELIQCKRCVRILYLPEMAR